MLTLQNTEAIRRIEEAIGYTFHDKRLLIQVLTRKTYLKIDPEAPDNEVLEFYGDTLMNYHVTNYFMSKYAHMLDDGLFFMRTVEQFTDMRSHYVCNRYLTDRVKAMGLARYLRAQNRDAELRRDGEKAYADVFESLVGAIYLDSCQNDTLIRAFILRQLGIEPKRLPADIEAFDYDSLVEPNGTVVPSSPVEEPEDFETLPEMPVEVTAVQIEDTPVFEPQTEDGPVAEAEATTETGVEAVVAPVEPESKVEEPGEQEAAPEVEEPIRVVRDKQDALASFCHEWGLDEPTYGQAPPNAPNARPVAACTMKYKDAKGKPVKISLNDSGKTLAEATEKAAVKMLKKLEKLAADGKIVSTQNSKSEVDNKPEAVVPVSEGGDDSIGAVPASEPTQADVTAMEEETPVVEEQHAPAETVAETAMEAPVSGTAVPSAVEAEVMEVEAAILETDAVAEVNVSMVDDEMVAVVSEMDVEQLRIDEIPPVEEMAEAVAVELPAVMEVQDISAEQSVVEVIPAAEELPVVAEEKPSKPSGRKRSGSSSKRKTSAKANQPAEDNSAPESDGEEAPKSTTEKKPGARSRKPRAKKPAEGRETAEVTEATPAAEETDVTE